jgi:MYXO-CTERM domain-containing protein
LTALGAAPPDYDAFGAAGRQSAPDPSARLDGPGHVSAMEARLGVPSFFWAPREPSFVRSLRAQGTTPEAAALGHLATWSARYGRAGDDVASRLALKHLHAPARGAVVASFEQRRGALPVFRHRVAVVMTPELELVAIAGALTPSEPVASGFQLSAAQAFAVALSELVGESIAPASLSTLGLDSAGMERFETADRPGVHLGSLARAKKVLYDSGRALLPAFFIELEASGGRSLASLRYGYVVSSVDGQVLFRHHLTQSDAFSYRVWADATPPFVPYDAPAGPAVTPHPTGLPDQFQPGFVATSLVTLEASPFSQMDPWLPPMAGELSGNNAEVFADLAMPDGRSAGDFEASPTAPGVFDHAFEPLLGAAASPSQRSAGLVQLFFDLNFLHDWFYEHGFTEAAGNAQLDNFGRGGVGGDRLVGEAQDFGGFDNANMSTPADGASPTMQMYLWRIEPRPFTSALGITWSSGAADFGPQAFDAAQPATLADDGVGVASDACSALAAPVTGLVVVVDRGTCTFVEKAANVQAAGGAGVLVVDDVASSSPMAMGGSSADVTIPVLSLTSADGATLRAALGHGPVEVRLQREPVVERDGALDFTIVAHEWGHYLSNRLISDGSGLSANQARSLGEGWSDFVALLAVVRASDAAVASNAGWAGAYAVAGYAMGTSTPDDAYYFGLRRFPYSTDFTRNPLTFKHIQDGVVLPTGRPIADNGYSNAEEHNAGEVWATMLWEAYAALLSSPRFTFDQARDRMADYLVASLKATPADPTFVEARDAWLAIAAATDVRDVALLGQAFARRGLGGHAVAPDRTSDDNTPVVEDFTFASELAWVGASLDDTAASCDGDGFLDSGERGLLKLTFKNQSLVELLDSKATITSRTPGVTVTPSTVDLTASAPFGLATGTVELTVAGDAGVGQVELSISWVDPLLAAPDSTEVSFRVNADVAPLSASGDDFEGPLEVWTPGRRSPGTGTGTGQGWGRRALSPQQHVWSAPNPSAPADLWLSSPSLLLRPDVPFVITLRHRYAFERDSWAAYDGAVVELSTDDGATWGDVGLAAGYSGVLSSGGDNPLAGRHAYVGRSAGYPAWVTSRIELGSTFAGRRVRVRLRVGSDASVGEAGWDLDAVEFSGLANTPFPSLVPHRGRCGNRPPLASAGADFAVDERAPVVLDSSGSTDADGDGLQVVWSQTGGPSVALEGERFTAPEVGADVELTFSLVVSDGVAVSPPDSVVVRVRQVNRAPSVAVADAEVAERSPVSVTATASDPDGEAVTFLWAQASGPAVTLTGAQSPTVSFVAPEVSKAEVASGAHRVVLRVTVSDGAGPASAEVIVTVANVNRAPQVEVAASGEPRSGAVVTLSGLVAEPDGEAVTLVWKQLTGAAVALSATDSAVVTFTAPTSDEDASLSFELSAFDGEDSGRAVVEVLIPGVPGASPPSGCGCQSVQPQGLLALLGLAWLVARRGPPRRRALRGW